MRSLCAKVRRKRSNANCGSLGGGCAMTADPINGLKRDIAVSASDLTKRFGERAALSNVQLEVQRGEIFGVLGPNGAGKTTLVDILVGLQQADTGSVSVLGLDMPRQTRATRPLVGVMPQIHSLPPLLNIDELLSVYQLLYFDRLGGEEVLDLVGLREQRRTRISRLSMGQRQRFAFGLAVIGKPQLLFLDEPTTALDPQSRRFVWDFIRTSNERSGQTTLLTTHSMEEAQLLCHRVMILDHGRVLALGSPEDLISRYCPGSRVSIQCDEPLFERVAARWAEKVTRMEHGFAVISALKPSSVFDHLNEIQAVTGKTVQVVGLENNSLEDVYLTLTGREMRN